MNFRTTLTNYWDQKPLTLIIWIAVFLRLIAAFFAKGWGMLDDHFLVIEIAQSWVDDGNFNHWLPWDEENTGPRGHTFLYAGLHFLLFSFFKWIHLNDPQTKMLIVRLLHAAFSMVVVIFGYKITEKLSDKKSARISGLLLAAFWFMPWVSVRNLVEVFSIPFLVIGTWHILKTKERKNNLSTFLLAGFITGIAFSIRYQTMIYAGGMGLALLFQKQIKQAVIFGTGYLLSMVVFQGLVDYFIWGTPFMEFTEYVLYNLQYRYDYITGPWYNYLLLLFALMIPPVSIFLLAGMFKNWRKNLIIFLPTFIFLAFHSYFPNKQERFILTIVPFIIILGVMGWQHWKVNIPWLKRSQKFIRGSWVFFWVVNIILLAFVSTMYSKRAQVETMTYLSKYQNVEAVVVDNSNYGGIQMVPQFYLDQWIKIYEITKARPIELLHRSIAYEGPEPRFFIFIREEDLEERLDAVRKSFPEIEFETRIEPGFVDRLLHRINPHNKNNVFIIYRNKEYFPEKIQ
jgi:hypothetical protein